MEHDRSDDETQSSSKRHKPGEKEDNRNQMAVANAADGTAEGNTSDANDASPPSIFKLDIDCCEELFAYLPLEDLQSLGQTCKRMHQFTGYFVRENYKSVEFQWRNGNLFKDWLQECSINDFIEFISILNIKNDSLDRFAQFAPRFKLLKKVCLILNGDQIDCIKEILPKCEEIDIHFDRNVLNIDLYENILKFCTNVKHFRLNSVHTDGSVLENNNWLLHEYPNLEYLDLYSESSAQPRIGEIRTFFTLNRGIRKFQTNSWCLWDCRHWIVDMDTDIKLDELSVGCAYSMRLNRERIDLWNTLYERGLYEHLSLLRLMLYDNSMLTGICAPLTMELYEFYSPLPPLDLKELKCLSTDIVDLNNILANNVSTIERIHFKRLKTENVLYFVRNFIELREIKIDSLSDVNSFNLATLNEERNKLAGAKSVIIYLSITYFKQVIKRSSLELVKIKLLK